MRSKLTVNALAAGNLRARRKQYTIMIIGIIFAMVFSSGTLFFISSWKLSMEEYAKNLIGSQDMIYSDVDMDFINTQMENGYFTDVGYAYITGMCFTDDESNGVYMGRLDDKCKEISYQSLSEGTYPQKANEIAVEKSMLARLGYSNAKIGDSITLNVKAQNGNDVLDEAKEKTYTLTGILKDKYATLGSHYIGINTKIPAVFLFDGAETDIGGKELTLAYIKANIRKMEHDYTGKYFSCYAFISDLAKETGVKFNDQFEFITAYDITYMFSNTGNNGTIVFAVAMSAILLTASCIAIVNAFNSNLNDRKKQIGIIKTLGATKRQIINIFGREAFIIALIATPVSMVISYFSVYGITKLMGENFIFKPDLIVLVLCALFGIVCVMAASLIPLISASRISPMQSVRNIEIRRKMKKKKIKSQKQFDTSSLLAKRSMTFSKGRQAAVSLILIATVLISCYGFAVVKSVREDFYQSPFDYEIKAQGYMPQIFNLDSHETGFNENNKQALYSNPYVDNVIGVKSAEILINKDEFTPYDKALLFNASVFSVKDEVYNDLLAVGSKENAEEMFYSGYSEDYLETLRNFGLDRNIFPLEIVAFDSIFFDRITSSVDEGKIDMNKLDSGEEILLVAPKTCTVCIEDSHAYRILPNEFTPEKNCLYLDTAERDYNVGDELDISVIRGDKFTGDESFPDNFTVNNRTVKIGAIIELAPDIIYTSGGGYGLFYAVTTTAGMEHFIKDKKYKALNVSLGVEITDEINAELEELVESVAAATPDHITFSNRSFANQQRETAKMYLVALIGIVVLFLAVSASIINNSITANIRDNKRQIGILRAVGASVPEMVKTYTKQMLSMFLWGVGIGFGMYLVSYFAANFYFTKIIHQRFGIYFAVWQTAAACVILFAICAANLYIRVRQEMKNSIIENIREL